MSEEKNVQHSHRLCPCNPMDIEGIQSWLEDLALEGLILEQESVFFGFWCFAKTAPQKIQYRLEVVRGGFMEDTDTPREEVVETAEAMGWEYVTKYRSFYIYRSFDPMARPLHTDPAVQALTVKYLRRQTWTNLILDLLYAIVLLFLRRSSFGFVFKDLAMIGPVYVFCYLGLFLLFIIRPITHVYYLHKAIKQLKKGNSLDQKKIWKQNATFWICSKIVPLFLLIGTIGGLIAGLANSMDTHSLEFYTGNAPFVSIQEVYPKGTVTSRTDMGDYNTFLNWSTSLSENTEWNESGHITVDGKSRHFILRITCYQTAAEWIAKGLASDCYTEVKNRYHEKHFEDLESPDVDIDFIRVYSSYGIRYVLLRQDNVVIHGTVSIDEGQDADHWEDWLHAAVDKLKTA